MEEKQTRSFYEFLMANSELTLTKQANTDQNDQHVSKKYLVISWIILFVVYSTVLHFSWNHAISYLFDLKTLHFYQSVLLYAFIKILKKGLFVF